MKAQIINLTSLILLAFQIVKSQYYQNETISYYQQNSWSTIESTLIQGSLNGYYSISESYALLKLYQTNFPQVIQQVAVIGTTLNGQPILAVQLAKEYNTSRNDINLRTQGFSFQSRRLEEDLKEAHIDLNIKQEENIELPFSQDRKRQLQYQNITDNEYTNRSGVLIASMYDGSDVLSMTMAFYVIKKFLFNYVNGDDEYNYLLETRQIWVVPFLNADSYFLLNGQFLTPQSNMQAVFKNQRPYNCTQGYPGVNLERNYEVPIIKNFTRHQPCTAQYEGPTYFSEPETTAMLQLLSVANITVALNLLQPSPQYLLPFNYLTVPLAASDFNNSEDESIFNDITKDYTLNTSAFTTAYKDEGTPIYGEVSDYMYAYQNIYAFSIKMGLDQESADFIISNLNQRQVLMDNLWPLVWDISYYAGTNLAWQLNYNWVDPSCQSWHEPYFNCSTISNKSQIISGKLIIKNKGVVGSNGTVNVTIYTTTDMNIQYFSLQNSSENVYCFTDSEFKKILFNNYGEINGVQTYSLQIPNFNKRQNYTIGYMGEYTGNMTLYLSMIAVDVQVFQSFDNEEYFQYYVQDMGNPIIPTTPTPPIDQFLLRKGQYILMIIYFALFVLVSAIWILKVIICKLFCCKS